MSKKIKTVFLAVLSVLYLAGLVAMFFNFGIGLIIWGASLLASLLFYLWQQREKLQEQEKEAEAAEAEAKENK